MQVLTASRVKAWCPKRSPNAHKGSVGRIFILAGSKGMVGAAVLTSLGAVKAGAGLVRLGTVRSQIVVAAKRVPLEVTVGGFSEIKKFRPNVVAIGPGLGISASARAIVENVLKTQQAVVADADALNVMAESQRPIKKLGALVMTPHPGELARLLNKSTKQIQDDRAKFVKEAARRFNGVCLLKGAGTLISDGRQVLKNTTGTPAMASGGMGDLLTGMIAALWGQMPQKNLESALQAAALGAFIHGKAGEMCAKAEGGFSVQASMVANYISSAIKNLVAGRN